MDDTLAKRRFWSRLIIECYDVLLRYARRLTNGDDSRARDLVQLVASRILHYVPDPTSIQNHKQYLRRSIFNCWVKSKRRVEEISLDLAYQEIVELPRVTVYPQIQTNLELMQLVDRALKEMVQSYPEVKRVWEMWLLGYSFRKIDEALGRDPGFAWFLWRKFINELRRQL